MCSEFLADLKKLATWMFPAEFEARPGAAFNFAPNGWHGKIGVFEEDRKLRFDAIAGGWAWLSFDLIGGETQFKLGDYVAPEVVFRDDARLGTNLLSEDRPGGKRIHWHDVLSRWHCGVDELRSKFLGE